MPRFISLRIPATINIKVIPAITREPIIQGRKLGVELLPKFAGSKVGVGWVLLWPELTAFSQKLLLSTFDGWGV